MRKIFSWCLFLFPMAGLCQNYNPFVSQGIISPAPLLPLEANGAGTASFNVGNSGSDPLLLVANQEMLLIITLGRGVPNNADPVAAISGTFKSYFDWLYDPNIKTYQGKQNQTIPGGLLGAGTIAISYLVTQNSTMASPQNGFNCNITPPAYSNGINSLADDQVSSYTWTAFSVSGNVFDDGNGYTNAAIDGTGSNAGNSLYVSLVGAGNAIIATVPVNADGSYVMYPPSSGNYTLTLHANPAGSSVSSLPSNWGNTAEGFGMISDGVVNGYIDLTLSSVNFTDANFGIDQMPQSVDINDMIPLGITQGEEYYLDNMPFSASDPEDGSAPGTLSTGYSFIITSLPTNANLYYNHILITPSDVAAGTGTAIITNYDPLLLAISFTVNPVINTQAIFTYGALDNAGLTDPSPATYTITITAILPANDILLSAQRTTSDVIISWKTFTEQGTDYFKVEKSSDGRTYKSLPAKISAAGTSNQQSQYQYLDKDEISAVVVYRVRIYYKDGRSAISNSAVVRMRNAIGSVQVFPNPVKDNYYVSFPDAGKYRLQLTDAAGRVVMLKDMEISNSNLNLHMDRGTLAAGNYQLSVRANGTGNGQNIKLIFVQR